MNSFVDQFVKPRETRGRFAVGVAPLFRKQTDSRAQVFFDSLVEGVFISFFKNMHVIRPPFLDLPSFGGRIL